MDFSAATRVGFTMSLFGSVTEAQVYLPAKGAGPDTILAVVDIAEATLIKNSESTA